ncbi:MAG: hypothetical protein ACRDBF_06145, partial [Plesiomonas shigelloides]
IFFAKAVSPSCAHVFFRPHHVITSSRHHVITQQITLIGRTTANQAASKDKAGGMGKRTEKKNAG